MRRTPVVIAAAVALSMTGASVATADVTDTVTATTVTGLLTLAGTGANVAVNASPGTYSAPIGATLLTVSDLTGTTNGWTVTATYSAPAAGLALGGDNMLVSAKNLTTEITGVDLKPAVDVSLATPVKMATTGLSGGTGVTEFVGSYKVRVPSTALLTEVYGATVTYTIAANRTS